MGMLLSLIPQELWVLVLVGSAFGLIFGLVPKGAIAGILGGMLVLSILGPILSSLSSSLPWWMSVILKIIFALIFINWLITLLFGKGTGGFLGALIIHDILLAPFRLIGFLARRR